MIRIKEELIGNESVRIVSECEECNSRHVIIVSVDEMVEYVTTENPIQDIFTIQFGTNTSTSVEAP
jgi:hypothetical protein